MSEECEKCGCDCVKVTENLPNLVIKITYNDNRLNKDESTYADNVTFGSDVEDE